MCVEERLEMSKHSIIAGTCAIPRAWASSSRSSSGRMVPGSSGLPVRKRLAGSSVLTMLSAMSRRVAACSKLRASAASSISFLSLSKMGRLPLPSKRSRACWNWAL